MIAKTIKILISMLFWQCILLTVLIPESVGQSDEFKILEFNKEQINDITLRENEGTYEIQITGDDPYLYTEELEAALDSKQHVLSFEYFTPTGLNYVQFYFAPPVNEDKSKLINGLNPSEGWSTFSVDLKEERESWGEVGDFLRIDLGNISDRKIQIRNLKFREPTAREIEIAAGKEKRKKLEARLQKNLQSYLKKQYPNEISEVRVDPEEVVVKGKVDFITDSLLIGEVRLSEHVTELESFQNASRQIDQKGSFEFRFDRFVHEEDRTYDRLLSKWVIGRQTSSGIELLSSARYAGEVAPKSDLPEDKLKGRKGIGGFSAFRDAPVSDLDSLGISSVTVNLWITNFMRSTPSDETLGFEFNGKTYYVVREEIKKLDQTLRAAASRDIIVSAIILIGQAADTPDKKIGKIFEHPDSDPAGVYSMANVTSPEGVEYYAAIMDFLARRYSRPDKKFGRIHHWIVHNEVDAGWVWTNAGDKTPLVFMDLYHKSMRLIHNIARRYNPHAQAFISLTHYWNWTSDEKFFHSKELLEILLNYSRVEGDFEWAIAHHPYPESLFEPKSWLDEKVDFTFDTPLITYKNLEVLDAWVKQPETLYKGKQKRTVFLSEQGLNSRDYTEASLMEQAAGMAYAWKKLKPLDGIDAFQYHNWQDNRGEGGLRLGLRRFPDDEEAPGARKPIWYVYKSLDTAREDSVSAFAKDIIGIDNWEQVRYKGSINPEK